MSVINYLPRLSKSFPAVNHPENRILMYVYIYECMLKCLAKFHYTQNFYCLLHTRPSFVWFTQMYILYTTRNSIFYIFTKHNPLFWFPRTIISFVYYTHVLHSLFTTLKNVFVFCTLGLLLDSIRKYTYLDTIHMFTFCLLHTCAFLLLHTTLIYIYNTPVLILYSIQ